MPTHHHGAIIMGLTILAWLIIWKTLLHAFAARHPSSAAAQGLSNVI